MSNTRKAAPRKQAAALQAAAEGAASAEKIEFLGETFRLAGQVGIFPLLKFSHYADMGDTAALVGSAAAMYGVLQETIHPDDWDRFEQHAITRKVSADDLYEVVGKCVEILTARPTGPPSGSSSTPSAASGNSTAT